jgi:hypothetical protein
MTCERLSDRMPAVALGRERWTDEERRHLESCPDCRAEWEMVGRTQRLGRDIEKEIDSVRVSAGVLHRLATEPVVRRPGRGWWIGIGTAAVAAGLFLMLRHPTVPPTAPSETLETGAFEIRLTELDSLDASQLTTVLEWIDDPLEVPSTEDLPSLQELDQPQLERVLRSLEG